jgi:hypothetical protein
MPAGTCGYGSCGSVTVTVYCGNGANVASYSRTSCSLSASQQNAVNNACGGDYNYWYDCSGGNCTVNAINVTTTNYTTNYTSAIRIANQSGVQHDNVFASSFNPVRSIAISTSGNTISYSAYNGAGKTGSVIASSSITPGSPTKGNRVGLFKTTSSYAQGSYVDNLNVTVA